MTSQNKKITITLSEDEYNQLELLAKKHKMKVRDFVTIMSTLLTSNKNLLKIINSPDVKKTLELDLKYISSLLEIKQKHIQLLLRSIYSTQLRVEGQIKKYRLEAAKELEKDFDRISMILDSEFSKK